MFARITTLFAFGLAAVLFGASQSEAQPGKGGFGKGGFGKGPGAGGSDTQKLEKELEKLLEQVKETKSKLARSKEAGGKGGFEGKGFDFKKKMDFMKKGDFKKEAGKGKGFGPMGFGGKGFEGKKLDPDTIKQKYEFYKKLYDELPKDKSRKGYEGKGRKGYEGKGRKGFEGKGGKGFEGKKRPGASVTPSSGRRGAESSSVEARIERLIRELEQLRSEVKGKKK